MEVEKNAIIKKIETLDEAIKIAMHDYINCLNNSITNNKKIVDIAYYSSNQEIDS